MKNQTSCILDLNLFLIGVEYKSQCAKCFGFIVSIISAKFPLFPFLSCGVLLIVFICLLYIREIHERFCEIRLHEIVQNIN